MVKILNLGILLLSVLCCTSAYRIRTDEEIAKREKMLKHADDFAELFIGEFKNYTKSGIKSSALEGMFKMMQVPKEFENTQISEMDIEPAIMTCLACRTTFALMLSQYRSGQKNQEEIALDSIALCLQLTSYSSVVCEQTVRKYSVSKKLKISDT